MLAANLFCHIVRMCEPVKSWMRLNNLNSRRQTMHGAYSLTIATCTFPSEAVHLSFHLSHLAQMFAFYLELFTHLLCKQNTNLMPRLSIRHLDVCVWVLRWWLCAFKNRKHGSSPLCICAHISTHDAWHSSNGERQRICVHFDANRIQHTYSVH